MLKSLNMPCRTQSQLDELRDDLRTNGFPRFFFEWNGYLVEDYDAFMICIEEDIPFRLFEVKEQSKKRTITIFVKKMLIHGNLTKLQRCDLILSNEDYIDEDFLGEDLYKLANITQREFSIARKLFSGWYEIPELMELVYEYLLHWELNKGDN